MSDQRLARDVAVRAAGCPAAARGAVRGAAALLAALLAAVLPLSGASARVDLRLDNTLSTSPGGTVDGATEALVSFGISDVRRRIRWSQDEARALQEQNEVVARQVAANESLIGSLKAVTASQERTLEALRAAVVAARAQRAAPPASPAPAVTPAPASAPAVVQPLPAPASPPPAGLEIAGMPIPHWTVEAVLAGLVALLVVWIVVLLRARRPAAAPALASAGAAAALDTREDAEVLSVLWPTPTEAGSRSKTLRGAAGTGAGDPGGVPQPGMERAASPASASAGPGTPAADKPEAGDSPSSADRGHGDGGTGEEDAADDGPATLDLAGAGRAAGADAADGARGTDSPQGATGTGGTGRPSDALAEGDWSRTMISRKAADPQALKEVDTLIAFEQFEKAKALLDQMLVTDPDNPEYLLRHYHVRTHGGVETSTDDEALLRAMMDGPLSDTMLRVKEIGRGLMPGNPLFEQQAQRDAAVRVLAGKPDGAGGNTVVEDAGSTTGIGTLDENAGSGTGIDSLTEVDEEDAEILDFTRSVGLDAGDTEPDDAASGTASDSASEDDDAVDPAFLKTVTLTLVPKPDEDEAARR